MENVNAEPNAKAVRALLKKLRHCDELSARAQRGEALDEQQLATVARAPGVRAELAALGAPVPPPPPPPPRAGTAETAGGDEGGGVAGKSARKQARPEHPPPSNGEERTKKARTASHGEQTAAEVCGFCRSAAHRAAQCTFGLAPGERTMLCSSVTPVGPCVNRLFVLPMRRCSWAFDHANPRAGRVDVGLRCAAAALFRSQGLRRNTQVALCFEGEPPESAVSAARQAGRPLGVRSLTISGGLVRDLRPDELSMSQRVRSALDDPGGGHASACALDAASYSASSLRGFEVSEGGALETLLVALRSPRFTRRAGGKVMPPVVLVLDSAGDSVETVCARLGGANGRALAGGVVAVVGDDRGLTADEERAVADAAKEVGARIERVSLGRETLFASHCIVLLNHYLDKLWHGCETPPGRTYSTTTRRTGGHIL